jgi:hypothetical protein
MFPQIRILRAGAGCQLARQFDFNWHLPLAFTDGNTGWHLGKYGRYRMDWAFFGLYCHYCITVVAHFARMEFLQMKSLLCYLGVIFCCLALLPGQTRADSIQLRNGRHLQGKYIGGTSTAIGFMTAGTLEYFATSEVLALVFDNSSDFPVRGLSPSPMKGHSLRPLRRGATTTRVQRVSVLTHNRYRPVAIGSTRSNFTSDRKTADHEAE